MCGRYTLYEADDLKGRYNLAKQPQFVSQDNYNVAPRQRLPIIYQLADRREAELMQWGFIPAWSKDPSKGPRPINTKAETVFDSPLWRPAVRHQRCLIPARGFYEWKHLSTNTKVPFYIYPKQLELFSFAGIYSIWKDVEGLPLYTFSIMTTVPNREMSEIHDRMPVILRPEQETIWLDPANSQPAVLSELLVPYDDGGLTIRRVGSDVNSTRHTGRQLIEAVRD